MKQYYIYKIICLCDEWNGKFYIGKHYGELNDNYTGSGRLIKEYFKEHDKEENVTYEKIILAIGDEHTICDLEREHIIVGLESELCLNMHCSSAGGSQLGQKLSEEAKQKISEANKGRKRKPFSNQHRRKMSEARKGMKLGPISDETKIKMSEAKRGRVFSEEHRRKMSEARKLYWKNKKANNEN